MKLEQAKPQMLPGVVTLSKKQVSARAIPLQAKAATPAQVQRAKNKLEQDRAQIERQAEQASTQRETQAASQEQARVLRLQDQAVALKQQIKVQRLADTQVRQQTFFSSFVKSPVQRKVQQQVKTSSIQTAQARDQYQSAIQPEILQRLIDDQMRLQSQQTRASQAQNDLNTRAEWFNTELPVLRAKHNHPDTPFLDAASVFKPADQQAFALGKTYTAQRLASGLTPTDAAGAILNIQRKADRDIALRGLLTGINPRQSDYTSIQRLVAQGEANLELQRQALLEDPAMQSQALQLAQHEAHPTSPNSGISEKIKTKLGGGNPLPEHVRQQLEAGLNTDLSRVRVHTDSDSDALSKSVHAKAFTTGNDIFFSSGAFEPNTKSGFELIAHETTHTVQQALGQVKPGIDADPSLETAAQTKGAELAAGFNPNFKFKNLENQAQPNSPLIASQPPAHRVKLQAMQRSSLKVQREPQAPTPVSPILDETALATLVTALLPVVPQKYQSDAQSNIPVILGQCFSSQIKNANQVAYILATAQHESRFGTKQFIRSESLVEDHNPLKTEHKKVTDKKTKKTHVEDIPYRSNHVNGHRVNADPNNTDNLDTYYDDSYGGRLGNVKGSSDAANYRGRGFVQITGRDNYKRLGTQLQKEGFTYTYDNQTYGTKEHSIDLETNPTHVNLVPELAAKILVSGMQNDSFAQGGKGLSTYITDKTSDFVGARGLVNGTDRAADIAKIAEDFAKVLTANNAWSNLFVAPDLTKQAPDIAKPGITPNQTMQRSALALQRDPKPNAAQTNQTQIPAGRAINRTGGVIDSAGVNLRKTPDSNGYLMTNLPQGTLFDVLGELEGGWYKVKTKTGGQTGYVAQHLITLAPDKDSKLHQIKKDQPALGIAEQFYSSAVKRGEDLRFYVNVLHHVNPDSMPNPSGDNWKNAKTLKDFWIWVPSVTFAKNLRGVVQSGSITGGAYDAVRDAAEDVAKTTIAQLPGGKQVLETIQSIGKNASKVLNDPGAFVTHLGQAVGQGFNQFSTNLPEHLEASVVKLFTGTMGAIDLPKTWDATGVLHIGLQMVGGTPEQLKQKLINTVPGGQTAIDASVEAKAAFSSIQQNGFAVTAKKYYEGAALQETILGGIKSYVLNTVVKQGIIALSSMFIPGAGIIQAAIKLYETIKFVWDKMKDIAATISAITSSLADIAAGNIGLAATKIKDSLVGVLGLGVGFLARVAHLDGIADKVRKLFDKIADPIRKAIAKVIFWFKGLVGNKGSSKPVAGDKSNSTTKPTAVSTKPGLKDGVYGKESFAAGKEAHAVWLEIKGGNPEAIIASTPKPAKQQLDGWHDEAKQKSLQAQVDPYINQGIGIATRAVNNLKRSGTTTTVDAVTIEQMWKSDGKALARVVTIIRNALGPEVNYAFVTDSSGVKRTKLVTISFLCPANLSQAGLRGEFTKQVEGQQEGLNKLSVPEWFTNRSSFLSAGRSNSEQRKFRENNKDSWLTSKAAEIQSRPYNQELLVQLRKVIATTELIDLQDVTKTPRVAAARARTIAELIWTQQAALHDPDQNAGGNAAGLTGLGDKDVNSSIGSQWKDRVYLIDREVAKIPEILRPDLKLNTRLRSQ